tara:strand:+ start:130 stop:492 length:363 start_codon:yes stop_codon:yes gene_type:complete
MCKKCSKLSYHYLYNKAFKHDHSAKKTAYFVKKVEHVKKSKCLRYKKYMLQHLKKAAQTQYIFQNVPDHTLKTLDDELEQIAHQSERVLKKIQKSVLNFLYKPNGRMFQKSLQTLNQIIQ